MKIINAFIVLLAIGIMACSNQPQEYDVVILNGRVMDPETNFDGIRNVGIIDGKIVTITEKNINGKESIDATGLVVAPGFIDTHHHATSDWGYKVNLRDGLTSQLDTEVGAINVGKWYATREGKTQANYGTVVSQEYARMVVMDRMEITEPYDAVQIGVLRGKTSADDGVDDWAVTPSNLDQMNQITKILDENLRQGALGIGSTIGYMAQGITTYEMWEAQKAAARYGRLTGAHVRFLGQASPPAEGTLGFDEVFANAVALNAPLIASHNNNYGWWEVQEKLTMARDQGYNMWAEHYPYTSGSTTIGAQFLKPEFYYEMFGKYEETLLNPQTGEYFTEETYKKKAAEDPGFMIVAFIPARKDWLTQWIRMEHYTVGSDAMPPVDAEGNFLTIDDPYEKFNGHPRTVGSHAKVIRLGRELDIPLMHILRQLSYWSALHLGDAGLESMKLRGRMQEGMVADITIFNPETARDNSDYMLGKNGLPSTGIPYVLVNGSIVVKDSKVQDIFPGQSIRYPVEEKGRFVPATRENWLKEYAIDEQLDHHHGAD